MSHIDWHVCRLLESYAVFWLQRWLIESSFRLATPGDVTFYHSIEPDWHDAKPAASDCHFPFFQVGLETTHDGPCCRRFFGQSLCYLANPEPTRSTRLTVESSAHICKAEAVREPADWASDPHACPGGGRIRNAPHRAWRLGTWLHCPHQPREFFIQAGVQAFTETQRQFIHTVIRNQD